MKHEPARGQVVTEGGRTTLVQHGGGPEHAPSGLLGREPLDLWVVRAAHIVASDPDAKPEMFDPAEDKIYRHPTFYKLPDAVNHM